MTQANEKFLHVNGHRMAYLEQGKGPTAYPDSWHADVKSVVAKSDAQVGVNSQRICAGYVE